MSEASPNAAAGEAAPAFTRSVEDLLRIWEVDPNRGLTSEQVARQREQFGENQLQEPAASSWWWRLFGQFNELVIWILIVAAIISGMMGEWVDTGAILAIVILNGVLGFIQEERAEQAIAALRQMAAPQCKVLRNGSIQVVPASELVPGDRIELEAGDNVPADSRLISTFGMRVQESALTGESVPVEKDRTEPLPAETALGDRENMVFMGTVVTGGKGSAVVTGTAMQTELGSIATMLQETEREPTPLQRRLAELGRILVVACLVLVAIVFILQLVRDPELYRLFRSGDWLAAFRSPHLAEVFLTSVSLAVAAVPEGLPAVVTLALAIGLQRMARRHALIRKLPSVETLGAVTVICSDKTGTLTRNEMSVREAVTPEHRYEVTGGGYEPTGEFIRDGQQQTSGAETHQSQPDLTRLLQIASWCNNATLEPSQGEQKNDKKDDKKDDKSGGWNAVGDPTEIALLVLARKGGFDAEPPPKVHELPFDSDRKVMSVVLAEQGQPPTMFTKGAVESLLPRCTAEWKGEEPVPLTEARRQEIMQQNTDLAGKALRVLGLASRPLKNGDGAKAEEQDLVFAGLVGMIDPPREEAKAAVQTCREAGIRPVMITGDHPATAMAIARELHIATGDDRTVTGDEMEKLDDATLAQDVPHIAVYARVTAAHKLRVIKAWKSRGQVVAMTGDGVNDAPAIKAADIGIAMGITGTDVTKEAAAMVLTDDNFASIINAVEEGRCIYDNIRKVLQFLLSCNFGEILLMLVAVVLGWPVPLLPIHLLWVNLVTDGIPALALAMEGPEPGLMQRKPRPVQETMLSPELAFAVGFQGMLVGCVVLTAFWLFYTGPQALEHARTAAFSVLVFDELLRAFASRSTHVTVFQLGWFTNRYLLAAVLASAALQFIVISTPGISEVFESTGLTLVEWLQVFGLALVPITAIEISKLIRARWNPKPQTS